MIIINKIGIEGMNCNGCQTIIERTINEIEGVKYVKANYKQSSIIVHFDDKKTTLERIQEAIISAGYKTNLLPTLQQKTRKIVFTLIAFAAIAFTILLAHKYGKNIVFPQINSNTSAAMIFITGLLTGLHCIGMCGSFVIGYTAKDAKIGRPIFRSHLMYGIGKTLSYALFGLLFGLVGSMIQITPLVSGISISIAGTFLIIYGLSILNIFSVLKLFRINQPTFISGLITKINNSNSPLIIGFLSGFILGCGPLQAMYMLAAGSGTALEGAKILTLFGLGTLPALFGFGIIARLLSNTMIKRFIQASGIILIILGLIMFNNGIKRSNMSNNEKDIHSCCHAEIS